MVAVHTVLHGDARSFGTKLDHPRLKLNKADASVFTSSDFVMFVLGAGLFVAARLWQITAHSLDGDEVFSIYAARREWSGMMQLIAEDIVHPPLFYMLLKLWVGIGGESLPWLRLFPLLSAVAALIPFYLLCRELKLRSAEMNLALLLMAVNGYLISHAQDVRMYNLLLLWTLCSLWLFVRFFNSAGDQKRLLLWLFIVNLLLIYTHYFGWLVVGTQFIFLLFWGREKLPPFLLSVAALTLCFSPWAYAVVQAGMAKQEGLSENLAWIWRPGVRDFAWRHEILNGPFHPRWIGALGLLLFGSPVLWWGWHASRRPQGQDTRDGAIFWCLALFSFVPTVVAFSASWVLPYSIWNIGPHIIVAVPYLMLVATAVQRLRPGWVKSAIVLLMVGWAALAGYTERNGAHGRGWDIMVNRMIQAEPSPHSGIMVYDFGDGWVL